MSFATLGVDQLSVDNLHGADMDVFHVGYPFAGIVDLQLFGDILILCHGVNQSVKHLLCVGVDLLQVGFQSISKHHAYVNRFLMVFQKVASALTPDAGQLHFRYRHARDIIIALKLIPKTILFIASISKTDSCLGYSFFLSFTF